MVVLLVSACGASTNITGAQSRRQAAASASAQVSPGIPGETAASATEVRVIKGWSDALRRGDVTSAAQYFAIPSQMINGDPTGQGALIRIDSRHDALLANEALPCGAKFVSAARHGRFVDALFKLTARPGPGGSTCSGGVGATARTFFLIVGGHITDWIRAPDEPGDNPGQKVPAPGTPTTPGALPPQSSSQV